MMTLRLRPPLRALTCRGCHQTRRAARRRRGEDSRRVLASDVCVIARLRRLIRRHHPIGRHRLTRHRAARASA
jgi:hypothetical protein